jgi:hypothetical protein
MILPMRNLFAVPWLSASRRTLFSVLVALILVFSIFGLLKNSSGGKPAPAEELLTGSIQRAPAVRKSPSSDPMAAFLAPALTALQPVQNTMGDRGAVPLPRPRPKRP